MGQRAAKKWERRAGPLWRTERLSRREKKRFQQACTAMKAFYVETLPTIMADLRAYESACFTMLGVAP